MKHETQAKLCEVKKVPDVFVRKCDVGVIVAEVLFTDFSVEHNIPLVASDHNSLKLLVSVENDLSRLSHRTHDC